MTSDRPLSELETAVLTYLIKNTRSSEVDVLLSQLNNTTVIGGPSTFPKLRVDHSRATSLKDGPLPIRAFVETDRGDFEGELIVWLTNGYLSEVEFAWVTDETPKELPNPQQLRITQDLEPET
jgi:hypothetical protein